MKATWILCSPRTGSSLLCELLNGLGVFPHYNHPSLQNNHRGPLEAGRAFDEWPRLFYGLKYFANNPPPYSKNIFHQYVEALAGIPAIKRCNIGWDGYSEKFSDKMGCEISAKYDSCFARKIFPDLRFLLLKRDVISLAVSLYIARTTRKYHIYDIKSLQNYMDIPVPVNDAKLIESYNDASKFQNVWDQFLHGDEKLMCVNYNKLHKFPHETLQEITDFLQIKTDVKKSIELAYGKNRRIYKMTRPIAENLEKHLLKLTTSFL